MKPGAMASVVAREAGIHASQLYRWRRQLCGRAPGAAGFAAVTIAAEPSLATVPALATPSGLIEIKVG